MNYLALAAVIVAVLALLGWAVGPSIFTTWITHGIAMKAPTALATAAQGLASIYAGHRTTTARRASIVLSVVTLTIAHGSLMLRFAAMLRDDALMAPATLDRLFQVPSVGASIALMLLAISILLYQFRARFVWPIYLSQLTALTIGTASIAGWALDLPTLYGYVSEYSGGVALPTAVCLACLALHGIAVTARRGS